MRWARRGDKSASAEATPPSAVEPPRDLVEELDRAARVRERLLANVSALVTAFVVVIVVLKTLRVSRGDLNTSLSIVNRAGPIESFIGIFILFIPFLGTVITTATTRIASSQEITEGEKRILWGVLWTATIVLSFVLNWLLTLLLAYYLLFYAYDRRRKRKKPPPATEKRPTVDEWLSQTPPVDVVLRALWEEYKRLEQERRSPTLLGPVDLSEHAQYALRQAQILEEYNTRVDEMRRKSHRTMDLVAISALVAVFFIFFPSLVNDQMWLPAEEVQVRGMPNFTAYILDVSPQWTALLRDRDRALISVGSADIVSRRLCSLSDRLPTTTIYDEVGLGASAPQYPKCRG